MFFRGLEMPEVLLLVQYPVLLEQRSHGEVLVLFIFDQVP